MIAARSATSPVADWTALNATTSMVSSIASAYLATGAVTTCTPRSACTAHGKTFEVNSTSGTSTRAPSGIAAATSEIAAETVLPVKTSSAATPTSRPNAARARPVDSSHGSQLVSPTCQSASACCIASQAGLGGSPYDAVFSHPGFGLHNC